MKHGFLRFLSLTILASLCLAACSIITAIPTETPLPEPIILTDDLGREVKLTSPAQRVVSLAPSNTEILFAIGAGKQVVARDEFSNYPSEAADLPVIGGSWGGYNHEAIVGLKPDLVMAAEINTPEQVQALDELGLTVYYLGNPVTLEEMYQNLVVVAQLTGHDEEADELIASLKERVETVEAKIAAVSSRPSVFYELDSTDPSAPYTTGPGTFLDLLIGMAGGVNIAGDFDTSWVQISLEELIIRNPDLILLGDANYGITPQAVAERAGWEGLEAVKNGKVFPFNDDLVSRPGPRLVDGLEALAKLLHPELFK